jgi:hypothetical protein
MFDATKLCVSAWGLAAPCPEQSWFAPPGFPGPADRSRWRRSQFYREARLSAGKLEKFTQRSSRPPPATVSLQSTQGKSITARQGDGNWRGAALSPPRTRKRTNSPRPGLCPTISKVFTERAVCARRSRRVSTSALYSEASNSQAGFCGSSRKIMSSVSRARSAGETRARSKTRPEARK